MISSGDCEDAVSSTLYAADSNDPRSQLIDRSGLPAEDVQQIGRIMSALGGLRDAEQQLSAASQRYMQLNASDMRALHYLIVAGNTGVIATPGAIAAHLGISSASTTKLLDRLESAGHIERAPHPTDRRALTVSITEDAHEAAMQTMGRQQAKRFYAAARLSAAEREVVIRFLEDMTNEITLRGEPWAQDGARLDDAAGLAGAASGGKAPRR